ncbi:MAG: type IV pilus secretin PilQ [Desulfobacterales bacterium]|nr:type IV pilus secretin PilQ [Desulfobacterales bacterium]
MKTHSLFRRCSILVAGLFVALIVTGCAGDNKKSNDQSYQKWKTMAEESRGYSPSSKRRVSDLGAGETPSADDLRPGVSPEETAVTPLPVSPVSLNMSDVDVAVLLRSLARAAGQNIMINEKVSGRANINIQRAPWDQVFLGLLKTHRLSYKWEGDIIRIMTTADIEQELQEAAQRMDLRELEPLSTRVIRIDYTQAADLKNTLEAFLTKSKTGDKIGSIMVDAHTNTLIVQALETDINNMLPLVEKLDLPTPQILIEAHIVEATSSTARELGIQWGGQYQFVDTHNTYTIGSGAASSGSNTVNTPSGNYGVNFPANVGSGAGMAIGFMMQGGANVLTAQLSALQNDRKLKILSSPSITTIDNQKAIFESGEEVPYQTVSDGNVQTEFKEALLKLEVTPHVIDGEALKLVIKVKKDEVDKTVTTNPPIITKKAETNVILYDGQTTVIGGLNSANDARNDSGVPGLKDIPGLGVLFRGKATENSMSDVLIFITPHILKQRIGGGGGVNTGD